MIEYKDIEKVCELINDLTDDEGNINCVSLIFKLSDIIEDDFWADKFIKNCVTQPQVKKYVYSQPLNIKEGK